MKNLREWKLLDENLREWKLSMKNYVNGSISMKTYVNGNSRWKKTYANRSYRWKRAWMASSRWKPNVNGSFSMKYQRERKLLDEKPTWTVASRWKPTWMAASRWKPTWMEASRWKPTWMEASRWLEWRGEAIPPLPLRARLVSVPHPQTAAASVGIHPSV